MTNGNTPGSTFIYGSVPNPFFQGVQAVLKAYIYFFTFDYLMASPSLLEVKI
jgi:hypothetical protein